MFSYERHMFVALAIAVVAIVTVVAIVVLGIPLPFLDN
jgi:ABC-type enterochelin transport system permease subunit